MGLSDGRKSVKIGLAVYIQYQRVIDSRPDRQTDRQTDTLRQQ